MVTPLLDPKAHEGEFGEFLRITLASLTNLDNLLCDELRNRIASFNQVELPLGQHLNLFRPHRKGFE